MTVQSNQTRGWDDVRIRANRFCCYSACFVGARAAVAVTLPSRFSETIRPEMLDQQSFACCNNNNNNEGGGKSAFLFPAVDEQVLRNA